MSKHTAGPWNYDFGFIVADGNRKDGEDIYLFETVFEDGDDRYEEDDDRREANCNLVAAAPTMFSFIETVAAGNTDIETLTVWATQILAKAKGEQS